MLLVHEYDYLKEDIYIGEDRLQERKKILEGRCAEWNWVWSLVVLFICQAAKEHYELLKKDYQSQVEKLTTLVDGGVNTVDFLQVSGGFVYAKSHDQDMWLMVGLL